MPADHLTEAAPTQLAVGVLAVLAGKDLQAAAVDHCLAPVELAEAVQVYQAAGYAALERRAEQQWNQVLVKFPDWEQAETIATSQLGPRLDDLDRRGVIGGWWFLRKHRCWRLRLRSPGNGYDPTTVATAVAETLTELTDTGALTWWRRSVYEPEYAAFGGSAAIATVHDLFCADSRGVLNYARRQATSIGRRELSIMLLHTLLRAAQLDWFESGDVFHQVAQLRPAPPDSTPAGALETLADNVRTLVHAAIDPGDPMFSPNGPAAFAVSWRDAFQAAGQQLQAAAADGRLDRGLRAVLTHVVIFHWNRLGLSATTQGVLAHAATAAFLPRT